MSWAVGFDPNWNRDIGYGVPAYCDHPGCNEQIDRGLAYVCCGSEPYGGEHGCGRFYCGKHENATYNDEDEPVCGHEDDGHISPERPEWMRHKLTDDSWRRWRTENQTEVSKLRDALRAASE